MFYHNELRSSRIRFSGVMRSFFVVKTHFDFVVPMDLTNFTKELFLQFFEKVVIYPYKSSNYCERK